MVRDVEDLQNIDAFPKMLKITLAAGVSEQAPYSNPGRLRWY